MLQPLISILTPFKNSTLFLEDCLNSIIAQSYTHWELLIVDDHSTDDSYNLVVSFAQKDARIKVYKNSGSGIIDALKLGFKKSTGIFITRMDSDDLMATDKLKNMAQDLKTHGKGHVALGLVNYFCDGELGDGYKNYEKWLNSLTRSGTNYTDIYKECVIPSPCWMVHRDDLIVSGSFESTIYPEDYDLAFRFYEQNLKCIPSHEMLHYWRDYSTRTSRTHENYAANHFLKLKIAYFLKLDRNPHQLLVLWGAGFKGKFCAKLLQKHQVPFVWVCNNPKKIGHYIYNIELQSVMSLNKIKQPQVIITVANKASQKRIASVLENQALAKAKDYFFFC